MSNDFLKEISTFSKSKLKNSETKISYANGRQFLISNGEEKEVKNEDENQTSSNSIYWSGKLGYLVDLLPDLTIDEIIPRLYLSGDDVATNIEILKSKKISHILNLTSNVPNKYEPEITYLKILVYDLPNQNILPYFKDSFKFLDNALKKDNNSVLVHCNAGVSRSSSFVIAYIMYKKIANCYKEAYDMVKLKRSKICPNEGFVKQLLIFETELSKQNFC